MQPGCKTRAKPHALGKDLLRWRMGGILNWLPSLHHVPAINGLSQSSQYVRIGGGGGGGGIGPVVKKSNLGTRVENPTWDLRFKPNTTLGAKIKKFTITKIMQNANFDRSAGTGGGGPCNENGAKRCLTYHAKGLGQTGCKKVAKRWPITNHCPSQHLRECTPTFLTAASEAASGDNCNIWKLSLYLCYHLRLLACPPSFHSVQCQFYLIIVVKASYILPILI